MRDLRTTQLSKYTSNETYEFIVRARQRTAQIVDVNKLSQDQLIEQNMLFAISVAKQYFKHLSRYTSISEADLIQEAYFGLCEAAPIYDKTKNVKFISFAVPYIRNRIIISLNEYKFVRVPANINSDLSKINRFVNKFITKEERFPSYEEILEGVHCPKASVNAYFQQAVMISYDKPVFDDVFLDDTLDGGISIDIETKEYNQNLVKSLLNQIPPDEANVVYKRFIESKPVNIIAEEIKRSICTVEHKLRQAMKKLVKMR